MASATLKNSDVEIEKKSGNSSLNGSELTARMDAGRVSIKFAAGICMSLENSKHETTRETKKLDSPSSKIGNTLDTLGFANNSIPCLLDDHPSLSPTTEILRTVSFESVDLESDSQSLGSILTTSCNLHVDELSVYLDESIASTPVAATPPVSPSSNNYEEDEDNRDFHCGTVYSDEGCLTILKAVAAELIRATRFTNDNHCKTSPQHLDRLTTNDTSITRRLFPYDVGTLHLCKTSDSLQSHLKKEYVESDKYARVSVSTRSTIEGSEDFCYSSDRLHHSRWRISTDSFPHSDRSCNNYLPLASQDNTCIHDDRFCDYSLIGNSDLNKYPADSTPTNSRNSFSLEYRSSTNLGLRLPQTSIDSLDLSVNKISDLNRTPKPFKNHKIGRSCNFLPTIQLRPQSSS